MNKQVVQRRREGVTGELRLVVQAMLDEPGDIHLSLARATDFAEVLSVVSDREEPVLIVLVSQAVAAAWAEELTRHGIAARALTPRDAPPKQPKVVFVGPEWLSHPDHRVWVEKTMKRVVTRGGSPPAVALQGVPVLSVEVAGEGTSWVPEGARREGFGFATAWFSVRVIGSALERQRLIALGDSATRRVLVGSGEGTMPPRVVLERLVCPHLPSSLAELARWIGQADVEEVEIFFGPDDLMRLQLAAIQRMIPSWPPRSDAQEVSELLAWLDGSQCRRVAYAAAFGESAQPCGDCDACERATIAGLCGDDAALPRRVRARPATTGAAAPRPAASETPVAERRSVAPDSSEVTPLALVDEAGPIVLSAGEAMALEALREWRTARARADEIPPYIVFGNATLIAIVRARPRDRDSFLAIKGCGEKKWERFGEEVVRLMNDRID